MQIGLPEKLPQGWAKCPVQRSEYNPAQMRPMVKATIKRVRLRTGSMWRAREETHLDACKMLTMSNATSEPIATPIETGNTGGIWSESAASGYANVQTVMQAYTAPDAPRNSGVPASTAGARGGLLRRTWARKLRAGLRDLAGTGAARRRAMRRG